MNNKSIDVENLKKVLRYLPDFNYEAIWVEKSTFRINRGEIMELPPDQSEFYDISLGTWCANNCEFCYTSAKKNGVFYEDICETWKKWASTWYRKKYYNWTITNAPFQIAIGSGGESSEHPQFCEFLKTVRETGVVPNYTTAGRVLGYLGKDPEMLKKQSELIEATEKYCDAVAISLGNKKMRPIAFNAIEKLKDRDVLITLHHIISDKKSVDEFLEIREKYGSIIHYHVLLPLVGQGRSNSSMDPETYYYLIDILNNQKKSGKSISDIAFGAKFIEYLDKYNPIKIVTFPEHSYSKNVLLQKNKVVITQSSFDLKPIKEIKLSKLPYSILSIRNRITKFFKKIKL